MSKHSFTPNNGRAKMEATKEKKSKERSIKADIIKAHLTSNFAYYRDKFKKYVRERDYGYAISWLGYDVMMEQHLERHLKIIRNSIANCRSLESIEKKLLTFKEQYTRNVLIIYSVEWDTSSSTMHNQEDKARKAAMMRVVSRLEEALIVLGYSI